MSSLGLSAGRPSEAKKKQALAAMSDESRTVRVNFDLSEDEHVRLKMYAVQTRQSVSDILRSLIEKHIPK